MKTAQSQRELNRQVVARYFDEFWTKGNAEILDTLCTEDYVLYYPLHGQHTKRVTVKKMCPESKEVLHLLPFSSNPIFTS